MSIQVMTQVWQSNLPPEQKYILLKLADYADDDGGHVYPSVATVARLTGVSERTVQRHLSAMREVGILEVTGQATQHRPTEYRIRGDKLTPLADSGVTPVTARGDTGDVSGVTPTSPYPSVEPSRTARGSRFANSDPIQERQPDALIEQWLWKWHVEKWGKSACEKNLVRFGNGFFPWFKAKEYAEAGLASLRDCLDAGAADHAREMREIEARNMSYASVE